MIIRCIEGFDGDIGFGFIDTADITSWRMIERNDRWVIQGLSTSNEMWVDICSYACNEENAKFEFCEFIDNIIESELTGYPVEKKVEEMPKLNHWINHHYWMPKEMVKDEEKSEPYIKYWAKLAKCADLFDVDDEEDEFKSPCVKCSPGTKESCCGCPEYFDWQKKQLKEEEHKKTKETKEAIDIFGMGKEIRDLRKDKSKPFYLPSADDCEDIEY